MRTAKILIYLILILLIASCIKVEEVKIKKIDRVQFKSLQDNIVHLDLYVELENPNNRDFEIKKVDIDVSTEDIRLGSVTSIDKVNINKNSTEVYKFKLEGKIENIFTGTIKVLNAIKKKNLNLNFKGYIQVRSGILQKKIKVESSHIVR